VGRAAPFEAGGYTLSDAQEADAIEWAKAQRSFTVGGLAADLEANGVPRELPLSCGTECVALRIANRMVARWCSQHLVHTAGGSRKSQAYRWIA
jgi:hypothetical protein